MQVTSVIATMAIVSLGQASASELPLCLDTYLCETLTPQVHRRQNLVDVFDNAGDACSVGNEDGECDKFGRCVQFIPPNEQSILNQGRNVAACTRSEFTPVPSMMSALMGGQTLPGRRTTLGSATRSTARARRSLGT